MKLERKKLRIYNPELGKLPGVKVFILFNIVIGAFVITPFLSIYSNVVTEFGVANLKDLPVNQRADALVEIAAPAFREELRSSIR